jgi:hypothetical protein
LVNQPGGSCKPLGELQGIWMVKNQAENNNDENRIEIRKRKVYSFLLALFLISPFMINQVWVVTKNYLYRSVAIIWIGIEAAILGFSLLFIPKKLYALSKQFLYFSQPHRNGQLGTILNASWYLLC